MIGDEGARRDETARTADGKRAADGNRAAGEAWKPDEAKAPGMPGAPDETEAPDAVRGSGMPGAPAVGTGALGGTKALGGAKASDSEGATAAKARSRRAPLACAVACALVVAGCAAPAASDAIDEATSDAASEASSESSQGGALSTDAGMEKGSIEGVPDDAVLSPGETYNLMNSGEAVIIDVRSHVDSVAQSIPVATNVPLDQLEVRLREVPRDRMVVVASYDGESAADAYDVLMDNGYSAENVKVMYGGMEAWNDAGLLVLDYRKLARSC